jgi:hypothetical protein
MANNLAVGESVYVPTARIPNLPDSGKAFYRNTIVDREDRSIKINLPNQQTSEWISTRYAHRHIGICVIEVGDYDTEATLLDPLSKSVLQNCRIMLGDDDLVRFWKVRSIKEIHQIWQGGTPLSFDQVIIIGHGVGGQSVLAGRNHRAADQLLSCFQGHGDRRWKFVLSCCELGRASFAKGFSKDSVVEHVIAPFHSVHGAVAAQFIQTYLVRNLISAETPQVAFKGAATSVPGNTSFRFWRRGVLKTS